MFRALWDLYPERRRRRDHGAVESDPRNRAAELVGLLAAPERLRVVAAVALGNASIWEIAGATALDLRVVGSALARLEAGGLVRVSADGHVELLHEELAVAARRVAEAQRREEGFDAPPESETILRRFFKDGRLTTIPLTRSKRLVVLDHLARSFEPGRYYTEPEVNSILKAFHPDHAALRRYLVDEGFVARANGKYWRTGGSFDVG